MKDRVRLILVMAYVLALPARTGRADDQTPPLRLDWVLEQVRRQNPDVKGAAAMTRQAEAGIRSARSWPDPQIGIEYWDIPRPGLNLGAANQRWLDFSQEIPFPAKTAFQIDVAKHEANRARAEAEKVLQDRLHEAKQAYWDLYTASASLRVLEGASRALGELARLSDQRNQLGHVSRMEQLMDPMAKMARINIENAADGLVQERTTARAALVRLMAVPAETVLSDPGTPAPPAMEITEQNFVKAALADRPDIHEAEHHLRHMQAARRLATANWFPNVMLQYSLVDTRGMPPTGMAMVKVSLPFVWFWRQGAEVDAAARMVEQSQANLDEVRNETAEMATVELASLRTTQGQLRRLRAEAVPEADRALHLGVTGYRAGSVGVADALSAVAAYQMTSLEAIGMEAQVGRSVAALERLIGRPIGSLGSKEMTHESD